MSNHVFMCYSREDQVFVLKLAESLKGRGVPLWLDQWNIPPGADWDQSIDNAICDCAQFIIVLSEKAVESPEVRGELRTALDEKKPIIPVIHRSCRVPRQLRTIQYVDFTSRGPDHEGALRQLLRTLGTSTGERVAQQVKTAGRPVEEVEPTPTKVDFGNTAQILKNTQKRAIEPARNSVRHQRLESRKPRTVFRDTLKDGTKGPEMVMIPTGTFQMGDFDGEGTKFERPVREVKILKAFAIGRFQVTFQEFDKFAASRTWWQKRPNDNGWGRGSRPVINVSWFDAKAYAEWLSQETDRRYRIPSEAEWEYAARSCGTNDKWAGTSRSEELAEYAWFRANSRKTTMPVGNRKPNQLGLYDMSGNVWEWVADSWHENYKGAPSDHQPWAMAGTLEIPKSLTPAVLRGGAWDREAKFLRVSYRYSYVADARTDFIGFRISCEID